MKMGSSSSMYLPLPITTGGFRNSSFLPPSTTKWALHLTKMQRKQENAHPLDSSEYPTVSRHSQCRWAPYFLSDLYKYNLASDAPEHHPCPLQKVHAMWDHVLYLQCNYTRFEIVVEKRVLWDLGLCWGGWGFCKHSRGGHLYRTLLDVNVLLINSRNCGVASLSDCFIWQKSFHESPFQFHEHFLDNVGAGKN